MASEQLPLLEPVKSATSSGSGVLSAGLDLLAARQQRRQKIVIVFGTRPEAIKLAPVYHALREHACAFDAVTICTGQHRELLLPFLQMLGLRTDFELQALSPGQSSNQLLAKVLARLDEVLAVIQADVVVVQGDTTSALAGALAGFQRQIPVAHVEAGLRTRDALSPFPEEMNRRLITRLARWHYAATEFNRQALLAEGVEDSRIFVTGNPVLDSLQNIRARGKRSRRLEQLAEAVHGKKLLVLTTHRRENLGEVMASHLRALRDFVAAHTDVALAFPVHPNPAVGAVARAILADTPNIHLIDPLDYSDFIGLLELAWIIVSDSGGIQEEAPSLGKPLLVLRENTERPEAVEIGVAKLVGTSAIRLRELLEQNYRDTSWIEQCRHVANPFGQGNSGKLIVKALAASLGVSLGTEATV